jgi:hypothetical protein
MRNNSKENFVFPEGQRLTSSHVSCIHRYCGPLNCRSVDIRLVLLSGTLDTGNILAESGVELFPQVLVRTAHTEVTGIRFI